MTVSRHCTCRNGWRAAPLLGRAHLAGLWGNAAKYRVGSGKKAWRGDFRALRNASGAMGHGQDMKLFDRKEVCQRFLTRNHGRDSTDDIAGIGHLWRGRAIIAIGHHLFHGSMRHAGPCDRHCRGGSRYMCHARDRGAQQTQCHEDMEQLVHKPKTIANRWARP